MVCAEKKIVTFELSEKLLQFIDYPASRKNIYCEKVVFLDELKLIGMETLIVTLKDKHEMQLVSDMLKKMRINTRKLSDEEREDIGLTKLMKQANRIEKVSRDQVMKSLCGE